MAIEHLTSIRSQYEAGKFVTIAGPCSVDTERLAQITIDQAKARDIGIIRLDLFKPRTDPFDAQGKPVYMGAQESGFPWLRMALQQGLVPATEVMMPDQAKAVIDAVRGIPGARIVLWNGARDTNQEVLKGVGKVVGEEEEVGVEYLIKCPWAEDGKAFKGSVNWARFGGARLEQLTMCYSGVVDNGRMEKGDRRFRDWEWALRQRIPGIPMFFDPSHIGYEPARIFDLTVEALQHPFDGTLLEVHPLQDGLVVNGELFEDPSPTDKGIPWYAVDELQLSKGRKPELVSILA